MFLILPGANGLGRMLRISPFNCYKSTINIHNCQILMVFSQFFLIVIGFKTDSIGRSSSVLEVER